MPHKFHLYLIIEIATVKLFFSKLKFVHVLNASFIPSFKLFNLEFFILDTKFRVILKERAKSTRGTQSLSGPARSQVPNFVQRKMPSPRLSSSRTSRSLLHSCPVLLLHLSRRLVRHHQSARDTSWTTR